MSDNEDVERYLRAARAARKNAERIASPWLRESFLQVANDWEKLAADVERLIARENQRNQK